MVGVSVTSLLPMLATGLPLGLALPSRNHSSAYETSEPGRPNRLSLLA